MPRKDFKKYNESFVCLNCKAYNPPAKKSERNHCFSCLRSLHVDLETPGDRKSDCFGLMEPIALEHKGKKGFMLVHKCVKCEKRMLNKTDEEDNMAYI